MTLDDPQGPFVLCYDGPAAAERAIRVARVLLRRGGSARVVYTYKPTQRSLEVASHRPVVVV